MSLVVMDLQFVSVPIRCGALHCVIAPFPSWPYRLAPQVQTVPSLLTATVWWRLASTHAQCVSVPTWVGAFLFCQSPTPSWPKLFQPQAHSVASVFTAVVCK